MNSLVQKQVRQLQFNTMRHLLYFLVLAGVLLTGSCQKKERSDSDKGRRSEKSEAIDHQELQKLLPHRLAGMKRVTTEGEKIGFLGLKYSQATAEYETGDAWAEVMILDGGGIARIINHLADDLNTDFEHEYESDEGYQRNIEIAGYPANEQYDYDSKKGESTIFVEDRFLVHIEAEDISERQFQRLTRSINLKKLGGMD